MAEKPLNEMLLELNEKVQNALYSEDNTGKITRISDLRSDLESDPQGGPRVIAEVNDEGEWSLLTKEDGYSAGLVGTVYEDMGKPGEPNT